MIKIKYILLFYLISLFSLAENKYNEIEISSDSMEWKREENVAIALGNAKATQGGRILSAQKIIVFFNEEKKNEKIYKLDASGKVSFKNGDQIAKGDEATFLIDKEKIIIKGNVKLEKDDSYMIGEQLSIDLKNDYTKLISSQKSGKVKAKYKTENLD